MRQLTVVLVTLLVTAVSAPAVRALLLHHNILDVPNHRSSHAVPVPRAGGVACLLGVAVGASTASLLGLSVSWSTLAAVTVLFAIGFIDDWRSLAPMPRLAAQVATGLLLGLTLGDWRLSLIAAALFPVIVNVVNFMDGINGISGSVLAVWGIAALLAATSGATSLAVLGALGVGVALGFLPWNVPRARLFLGDSGSYLMGGLIAGGVLVGAAEGAPVHALLAPLALYVADVGVTLVRRRRRGAPLMEAHREHTYQRLVSASGMSHVSVALLVAAASGGVLACWLMFPITGSLFGTAVLIAAFLALPSLTEQKI